MTGLHIIPAQPEHLQALTQLSAKTFYDTYAHANTAADMAQYISDHFTEEQIRQELSHKDTFIFLAYESEELIGYIKLGTSTGPKELQGKKAMEVERVYVRKEFQSKQTGKALLEYAFDFARQQGMEILWLGVWKQNPRAVAFYKRMGLQISGEQIFTLGRDLQEDFIMTIDLRKS